MKVLLPLLGVAGFCLAAWAIGQALSGAAVTPQEAAELVAGGGLMLAWLWPGDVAALLWRSLRIALADLPVLLPFLLLFGVTGHLLIWQAGQAAIPQGATSQQTLVRWMLAEGAVGLVWGIVFLPLIDAAAIHCWRMASRGDEPPSLAETWAWVRSRYRRMFGPHAGAYCLVSVGMTVLVPGIVFGMWYAFVNPIAATDDRARHILRRSQRLTVGWRGRIFRAWAPYAAWYLPSAGLAIGVQRAEAAGAWAVAAFGLLDLFLLVVMQIAMMALYDQRIEAARRRRAELEAASPEAAE